MANEDMLLRIALQAAIPLYEQRISNYPPAVLIGRGRAAGELLGCFGDALLFRPKTRTRQDGRDLISLWLAGDHAPKPSPTPCEVFNALAEGIACAFHVSGGGLTCEAIAKWLTKE